MGRVILSQRLPGIEMFYYAEWTERALCRNIPDPDIFFPETKSTEGIEEAKELCARCPVSAQCAKELWHDPWSIVAGLTAEERGKRQPRKYRDRVNS